MIMRFAAILLLLVVTLLSCKSSSAPPSDDETTSSDIPPPWVDDTPSIYERIKAPELALDTVSIYSKLAEALRFTNQMKRDGITSYYSAICNIDKTPKITLLRRDGTSGLEREMMEIEEILLNSISVVNPAFLVKDESIAVDYSFEIHMYIDDDEISIRVCGEESKCFLKHVFKRPL